LVRLPTKKQSLDMKFPEKVCWCITGMPKTGKSYFASTFPKPLIIDIEDGAKYLDCYRIVPENLVELWEIIEELKKGGGLYKTVVLDTVDMTSLWIERDICEKRKVDSIGSIPYGEGRSLLNTRLISLLEDIMGLDKTVVLVTHTRDSGGKHSLLLTEALAIYVQGHADIIAHCYKSREGRKLRCKVDIMGSDTNVAGSRHPYLSQIRDVANDYLAIVERFEELVKGDKVWSG